MIGLTSQRHMSDSVTPRFPNVNLSRFSSTNRFLKVSVSHDLQLGAAPLFQGRGGMELKAKFHWHSAGGEGKN